MRSRPALVTLLAACGILASCGPGGSGMDVTFTPLGYAQPKSLAGYRGRVVVMTLWATWCPYCRGELPALEALARRYDSSRVVNLILSDEDERTLQSFAPLQRTRLLVARIDRAQASRLPGVRPVTFILDRDGVIVATLRGAQDLETLEGALRPLLAGD